MARRFAIILFITLTVSAGCTSSQGFNRSAISETLLSTPASDQQRQLPTSRLSTPFHLAVFFIQRTVTPGAPVQPVDWRSTDGDALLRWLTPLQDEHILADTFVLIDPTIRGEHIENIKQAAVRYGADAVLLVDGSTAIDRYNNGYASLYPTVLGAYLAPGTVSQALVMMSGSLWDVRSDWHAPTETVEGSSKAVGPAFLIEDGTAIVDAKEAALEAFSKRVAEQIWILSESLPRTQFYSPRVKVQENAKQE